MDYQFKSGLMTADTVVTDPGRWVGTYADYLYAFARKRIADDELVKDLVQETFLAALQKIKDFEGKSSERTWLTAILKNKIIDVYRKKSSVIVSSDILNAEREQKDFFAENGHWNSEYRPLAFGIEGHQNLDNKEFDKVLKQCMEKLPALWFAVFTMKHIDEESSDTICTQLKVSAANFWVIIHRTKLNLRACLQKNWI